MKNAMVLEDHYGDDGMAAAGTILTDVTTKRFEELEKKGLVREATTAEVKEGSKHAIEADPTPVDDDDVSEEAKAARSHANKKAADPANKGA
jgi:hypothetical protein